MGAKWAAIFSLTLTKKVSSLTSSLTYKKSELAHLKTHENGGEWVRWARSPHLSQWSDIRHIERSSISKRWSSLQWSRTSSFGLVVHLENAILARIIKDQSFHMPITSLESLICTSEPASWFLVLPSPPFYQFSTSKTIQKSRYFRTLRPPSKQLLMDWAYFN